MKNAVMKFGILVALLPGQPHIAHAAQWRAVSGTSHFKAAYDEQSALATPRGSLQIRLRFIPRGEAERKTAAVEYDEKRYGSHLEHYEIDCHEQTALLNVVTISGSSGVRLKQLQGGMQPEPILPGSVLDRVSKLICPVPDDGMEDETTAEDNPEQHDGTGAPDRMQLSGETLRQLETLKNKIAANEATAETWKEVGNIYFDADQPDEAINAYEKSLALRPDDTDVLNDQGAMYRQTGDFQQALAAFNKALSIDPYNLESLYNSGYVYAFDVNDIPRALAVWQSYLELESKSERARQVQSFIDRYGKSQNNQ